MKLSVSIKTLSLRAQKEKKVKGTRTGPRTGTRAGTRIYCYISAGARFWSVWVLERARNRARGFNYIRAGALIRSAPQAQTPNKRASFARESAPDRDIPQNIE